MKGKRRDRSRVGLGNVARAAPNTMDSNTTSLRMRYLRIPELDRLLPNKSGPRSEYAPTWIRSYCDKLRDFDFTQLPDAAKGHYFCLCLLAAQLDNQLPPSPGWLAMQIHAKEPIDLGLLINSGLIEVVEVGPENATAANISASRTASTFESESASSSESTEGKGRELREGNGIESKGTEENAAPSTRKRGRPRKAAQPTSPDIQNSSDPEPGPPSGPPSGSPLDEPAINDKIDKYVSIIWPEVHAGIMQVDRISKKGFHSLSNDEFEEMKARLRRLQATQGVKGEQDG